MFNFLRRQSHSNKNKEQDAISKETIAEDVPVPQIRRVRLPQQNSDISATENEEELPKVKTEPAYTGSPIRRLELVSEDEESEDMAEVPSEEEQAKSDSDESAMPVATEPGPTPFEETLSSIEEILNYTGYYDKVAEEKADQVDTENNADDRHDQKITEYEDNVSRVGDTEPEEESDQQGDETVGAESDAEINPSGTDEPCDSRTNAQKTTEDSAQDNPDDTALNRDDGEEHVQPIFTFKMPRPVTFRPGEPLTMEQMAKESSFHLPLPKEMQADNKKVHLTWFKSEFEQCRTKEEIEDFAHRLTTNDLSLIFPILATVKNFRDRDRLYAIIEARAGRYLYIHGWTTMQYTYPNSYVQRGLSLLCQTMEENALPFHSVNRIQDAELFSSQDLPQDHFNWTTLPLISAVSMPNNRHFISDLVQFAVDHDYTPDRLFQMFGIYTDTPFAEAVLQNFIEIEDEGRGEGTRGLRRFF